MSDDQTVKRFSNGQVVCAEKGLVACDVITQGGTIIGLGDYDALLHNPAGAPVEEIDLSGLVVMPGVIDPHLHLGHGKDIARPRVPEDAATESAAAAVGGITTFIPYLMSTEPFETQFDEVCAVTQAGSRIDFGYHFIISTEAQLSGVPVYARDHGVTSFKIFMNNRGGEGARLGGVVCPHPETIEIAWVLRERLKQSDPEGKGGLATWNASRPDFVEADAVQRAAYLGKVTGAPVYIVHTSSQAALEAALMQRRSGSRVTIETCPHYLTHDETWSGGVVGKINPPLRTAKDREALWQAIADGHVDTIGTDHVHRDISSKSASVWDASPGCPGLETLLPVMLSEGHTRRGLTLERIAQLTSTNVAKAFGLSDRKGRIAVGMDADFAVIDPKAQWVLDKSHLKSSAGYSIYEGQTLTGRVIHTVLRGRMIMRDLQLDDQAIGGGRYVSRLPV